MIELDSLFALTFPPTIRLLQVHVYLQLLYSTGSGQFERRLTSILVPAVVVLSLYDL